MEEQNNNRKTLISVLIRLAVSFVVQLLCLPVGTRLAPIRNVIWSPLGKKAGAIVFMVVVAAALGVSAHALMRLTLFFNKKLNTPSHRYDLFFALGMIYVGFILFFINTWLGFFCGLALEILGFIVIYPIIRESRSSRNLHSDGEMIHAEIINITQSNEPVDGAYIYTVLCQANDRIYIKKSASPLDADCIGKMVPVRISVSSPEDYDVDLEHMVSLGSKQK